jgi:hypothetical protein
LSDRRLVFADLYFEFQTYEFLEQLVYGTLSDVKSIFEDLCAKLCFALIAYALCTLLVRLSTKKKISNHKLVSRYILNLLYLASMSHEHMIASATIGCRTISRFFPALSIFFQEFFTPDLLLRDLDRCLLLCATAMLARVLRQVSEPDI